MEFLKSIVGKDANTITFNDVENFFKTSRLESNIVEFKSFNSIGPLEQKLEGIFQAICSFLNSEGGLIIWGAPEGQKVPNQKEKEFVGPLKPLNQKIEKDALINKISAAITPMPSSVLVHILEQNGTFVYLFEIDRSPYSPHQTNNIYYMRIDGQKKPAPHHYIEALFRKITFPNLGGYMKFNAFETDGNNFYLKVTVFIFNHSALQNEESVTIRVTSASGIFEQQFLPRGVNQPMKGQISDTDFAKTLHYGSPVSLDVVITYTPNKIVTNNYNETLLLHFGGKNSPMKSSTYELLLKNVKPKDANELLVRAEENVLMYDYGKGKGSEEEKLKRILGR